jgi:putative ABC transport system permease protein
MFRHLMKLTWKRKSRNLMLSLELLLAFAIVFAITAFAVRSVELYHLPIGFNPDNVWSVTIHTNKGRVPADAAVYDGFRRGLRELPEVEQVAFSSFSPFTNSTIQTAVTSPVSGKRVRTNMLEVSDDFFAATGMKLVEGRGFSAEDDGAQAVPVVINRAMAEAMFPHQSALGKQFSDTNDRDFGKDAMRIVGIVDEFRDKGELMTPVNFTLTRFVPKGDARGMEAIVVKLRPGTERAFEATLNRQLKLVRNDWSYEISPLDLLRKSRLKEQMMPLIILAVIAAFMLAMVTFGLFGVLWQNTTRRIPEIGLRRALGATSASIYRQIVTEQLLLSSVAMLVGLVLLAQLPITGVFGDSLNWKVFFSATALSMGVIYLISLLCALYPGWRASRLDPADALHYE